MATWDGSESEDPNYFMYMSQNGSSNRENWPFFTGNGNNAYYHNSSIYPQNEAIMYEQNISPAYYHLRQNIPSIPSITSELVAFTNVCQEQLPSAPINNVIASNDVQCFQGSVQPAQSVQYFHCESKNSGKKSKSVKGFKQNVFQHNNSDMTSNLVEHSNLHATANEFIPNIVTSNETRDNAQCVYPSTSDDTYNPCFQESGLRSENPNIFPLDNRDRIDRKYDKKNVSYKPRDTPFQKGNTYKGTYRAQNAKDYSKPQSEKYFNNRHYLDKSYREGQGIDRRLTADTTSFQDTSNNCESLQEGGQYSRMNVNFGKGKKTYNNDENNFSARHEVYRTDKLKRYDGQRCEFSNYSRYNSNCGQTYIPAKNTKKYPINNKNDKYENNYREKRNNHLAYNSGRNNYDKQYRTEKLKDKNKIKDDVQHSNDKDIGNWRRKHEVNDKNVIHKRNQNKKHETDDDASQRERLTEQLNRGQLECLVCCEYIKQTDYIWSCSNCYHVLHLKCIKKWAKSSHAENGWRCPACQNVNSVIPEQYYCFCGKTKTPEWNRRDVAHSCGEICGRTRSKTNCVHKCTLLCHPGSCPSCIAMVIKFCGCGKTSQTLQCSTSTLLHCDSVCSKDLNCGKHKCEKKCHHGECGSCEKVFEQECYCGKNKREVTCEADISLTYSCGNVCEKLLDCGNHTCKKTCHADSCDPCALAPEKVTTCSCGQSPLVEKRTSCLDPLSICDKICSKRLACGQPSNPHTCQIKCHEGKCPDCELSTVVKCRCGNMDKEIVCKDLTTKADDARCAKRCVKKRSCGKHKCNQLCCIDIEHICPLRCTRTLSCGKHTCEQNCHPGRCQPCWRTSFDELYCECGTAVIYPPVPCGTRRPTCNKPCSREHACGHEVLHNCHSDTTCPPCTVLTQKWCYGRHELRKAVPCFVNVMSCGLPCNKPISCGRHKCITICHSGSCEKPGQQCVQPCTTPRELCGHACAAPCHEGKCPDTPCKEMVKVTCQCGHRSMTRACAENSREYQRIASSILASKMADMQLGHSVDLEEVFGQGAKKQNQLKTLECNDECKLIERNRRLALGLQIVNPDLSGKLMPRYSEFMKQWAKKDPHFCQMVHDKLTELVQLAKTSKQKSRSYSFDSMNRDKRHFVHESCEHFGCESQAYDQEPKRNVVATAIKDKCWLPSYSLLEIVQRENGQRKVPGPMLNTSKGNNSVKTVLSLPVKKNQKIIAAPTTTRSPEPEIDYFDYQG